eukprot:gene992-biopygen688
MSQTYILTLSCPDRLGLVHAVSGFLLERGGNIEEAAQYNDQATGLFFMRVQFSCGQVTHEDLQVQLKLFAEPHAMQWSLHATSTAMRTVIFVSKEGHCLNDLLFRWKSGLLPLDIRAIVSNHREFYQLAASYNVPFHHIPVNSDNYEMLQTAHEAVARIMVLARSLDGVISGEHGIGITKLEFLTDAELANFTAYKAKVDPEGRFNKGKLLR